jgi:hypothetical protein
MRSTIVSSPAGDDTRQKVVYKHRPLPSPAGDKEHQQHTPKTRMLIRKENKTEAK